MRFKNFTKPTKLKVILCIIVLILCYFFLVLKITSIDCIPGCDFEDPPECEIVNFSKIKILPSMCSDCGSPCVPFSEVLIEYLILFAPPILLYLFLSFVSYIKALDKIIK